MADGIQLSVWGLATGWIILGSNSCVDDIFHNCPDRPRDPTYLLRNAYRPSFSGENRPGGGNDHSPTSIAEVVNE